MALYHKWDVKNGFAYLLQVFSLISDGLGGVFWSEAGNFDVIIVGSNTKVLEFHKGAKVV